MAYRESYAIPCSRYERRLLMADDVKFVDPTRKEIQFASGPCSVTRVGDFAVITFTQVSPRIEGIGAGTSQSQSDAVVLCRIALPQQAVAELVRIIAEVYKADTTRRE
jgi:hypothetical protein